LVLLTHDKKKRYESVRIEFSYLEFTFKRIKTFLMCKSVLIKKKYQKFDSDSYYKIAIKQIDFYLRLFMSTVILECLFFLHYLLVMYMSQENFKFRIIWNFPKFKVFLWHILSTNFCETWTERECWSLRVENCDSYSPALLHLRDRRHRTNHHLRHKHHTKGKERATRTRELLFPLSETFLAHPYISPT